MSASTTLRWRLSPHETTLRLIVDRRVMIAGSETRRLQAAGHRIYDETPTLDGDTDAILARLAALDGTGATK